jgi:hypothetical protein
LSLSLRVRAGMRERCVTMCNDHRANAPRVMVKLQLNLPWKPVLAWPWSVTHVFSARGLIAEHIEGWEIDPAAGVAQVFRPAPKVGWPNSK